MKKEIWVILVLFVFVLCGCDKLKGWFGSNSVSSKDQRGLSVTGRKQINAKDNRLALIIGNADYRSAPLANPVNDARSMAESLKNLSFDISLELNADQRTIRQSIREFGDNLKYGGIGLFFYAGHGMQVKGKNYLIPVGTDIQREDEVQEYAVDAGLVLRKMESAGNLMNIIILDACRDNPFARSFRSSSRGLGLMDAPKGSIIVYSTAPGSVAADGEGENSVFTKNFLKHITTPGLEVGMMLRRVRADVVAETDNKQIPWDTSSLMGEFYFIASPVSQAQTVGDNQPLETSTPAQPKEIEKHAPTQQKRIGKHRGRKRSKLAVMGNT